MKSALSFFFLLSDRKDDNNYRDYYNVNGNGNGDHNIDYGVTDNDNLRLR